MRRRPLLRRVVLVACFVGAVGIVFGIRAGWCVADDVSEPGEVTLEVPTFHCLGVRWVVAGDDNRNATVKVEYRRRGSAAWKRGLDLFRVETEYVRGVTVPEGSQLLAGSVFDLTENTEYELRLTLADPDGGNATRALNARTWKEPAAPEPRRTLHVAPGAGGGNGSSGNPFKGLSAADAAARPGDLFLLHKGIYRGTAIFRKSGTVDRPIVWRAAGDGEAVIDGGGAERAVTAGRVRHVIFEDLTFRNARWAFVAHESSNLTIRRCRFTKIGSGFTSTRLPSSRHVIVDCVFEGPSTWPRAKGIEDIEGVQLIGDGHVVAYNRLKGFGDAISIFRGPSHAVDFHNNDISECTDDGIEMDYGCVNTRCFRNRLTNCFQGISVQPLYGGPCYIFRNAMYNIGLEVLKMHNVPSGFLYFHNTSVKAGMPVILYSGAPTRNSVFRNNLFIGTAGNYALESTSQMIKCDWDYSGYGGGPFLLFAKWNRTRYGTFDDFRRDAPIERHAVLVNPARLFATGVLPPVDVRKRFPVTVNDLRLKPGTKAIDAGVPLPNINDGFKGKAPDLGVCELGDPLPHYGPRPSPR